MGNPDAVASAYSLYDYGIAHDLGGEEACVNLRERAWQRGIRLASDMVPNHMGIDSRWMIEHPDRFIALDYSPYPSYTFNGPDLSGDERVGMFLEDHYYTRSDAAVVFKRVDRWTGNETYIYHGNDGTSMPWNDTAQLNFLNPEVREAVIQTILQVARQFPIIRFDAAMTLAKKHYQRLWFPEPGTGGDIASRSEHGMIKAQFDALMPQEFWREVVDRAAIEAPDTLLLAEAFWMMEGYFVRTLGMHRVYNSAFMNILRDEENAKYRTIMKNTLEFDPEILKRFVNFMNNPDERTAVDQFGKDDKYFGICTLMVTLPGLPMFGHGQVEGFTEKYGMEYRRAYWDERPDRYLIHRHEREIFPLLHRRSLFADVTHFRLYDLVTSDGGINEDVYAYSNQRGDERALVVYHNRFATAKGWIKTSVGYATKDGDDRGIVQQSLREGLGLHNDENYFCLFRDHVTGLQFLRNSKELYEHGLYVELDAYRCHVFLNFREVRDTEWNQYGRLAVYLNGRGVPSIEEAARELVLRPILEPFKQLVHPDLFQRLLDARVRAPAITAQATLPHIAEHAPVPELDAAELDEVEQKLLALLQGIKQFTGSSADEAKLARETRQELAALLQLAVLDRRFPYPDAPDYQAASSELRMHQDDDGAFWGPLLGWLLTHGLGKLAADVDAKHHSRSWIDDWRLDNSIASTFQQLGLDGAPAWRATQGIKLLLDITGSVDGADNPGQQAYHLLETVLKQPEGQHFLQINRSEGVLYFNKEAFAELLWWLLALAAITSSTDPTRLPAEVAVELGQRYALVQHLRQAEAQSGYQVEPLLVVAKGEMPHSGYTEYPNH
jgi:glycosidase